MKKNKNSRGLLIVLHFVASSLQGITVSGNSSGTYIQSVIEHAINMDGQLDQTFGNNAAHVLGTSYVNGSIAGFNATINDQVKALALQSDGKIVVGGTSSSFTVNGSYFALARFNSDGTLDSTFGQDGQYTTSIIPGTVFINQSICESESTIKDSVFSLVMQNDGKIVLAGSSSYTDNGPIYCALARFMPDGSLDSSFGVNGTNTASIIPGTVYINESISNASSVADQISAVTLQLDGKIVAGGQTSLSGNDTYSTIMQFTQEGALDSSFIGGNGTQSFFPGTIYIGTSLSGADGSHTNDQVKAIVITTDGLIIAGAVSFNLLTGAEIFAFAQYDSTGALVSRFTGGNGTATVLPGTIYLPTSICNKQGVQTDFLTALALQSDGKIVAGGSTGGDANVSYFALARLLPNGALDSSFGSSLGGAKSFIPGTVFVNGSISGPTFYASQDSITAINLQNDQKIIVGGYASNGDEVPTCFAVARFLSNGILDSTFGETSSATTSLIPGTAYISTGIANSAEPFDQAYAAVLRSNGSFVVGGTAYNGTNFYFIIAQFFNPLNSFSYQKSYAQIGAGFY